MSQQTSRSNSSKSPSSKSTGGKKPPSKKKTAITKKRTTHRTIRSCVYIFLSFIGALSMFNVTGVFIDWYKWIFASLFGFGYYLMPFVFISAATLILLHMKGKVRLREGALLAIPVFFGAMGHIVRDISVYPGGIEGFKLIAASGRALTSGGIISGGLGIALKWAISAGGGIFFCVLAIAACIFIAAKTNPMTLVKKLKLAPEDEDPEPKPKKEKSKKAAPPPAPQVSEEQRLKQPMATTLASQIKLGESPETAVPPGPSGKKSTFIDFFRKDRLDLPEDEAAQQQESARHDPTAPIKPTFETDDVRPKTPDRGMGDNVATYTPIAPQTPPSVYPTAKETETKINDYFSNALNNVEEKSAAADVATAPPTDTAQPVVEDTPPWADDAPPVSFDIFTEDNPPPAELSLDEKRAAAAEAHEEAARNNDQSAIISDVAKKEPGKYIFPPLSLLTPGDPGMGADHESIVRCAERLVDTLKSFNIEATIVNVTKGPTVTRYELQLQRGTKFAKVTSLSEDIALTLGAVSVRIAPIPANNAVGIEVPNEIQEVVSLRDLLQNKAFTSAGSRLTFAVGKDIAGQCIVGDVAKMPHMLVAGTTGSGKSVCINSILISLIYKSSPEDVKLILIDPKMIELSMYNGIPHLLIPVVTDPKKASGALNWAVGEMMRRYKLLSECNARNLEAYNEEMKRTGGETLPQIVIVIDELADLMLVAAREVEESIARIAQMARAAGMHLIIATQRPSADVITGLMKANIPSRVAFAVASQIESRIILDQNGAEKLIGRGDMLYNPLGQGKPMRIQGCFISSEEVESVIEFVKTNGTPNYSQDILDHIDRQAEAAAAPGGKTQSGDEEGDDPMLIEAISVVVDRGEASTSLLQRRLKLGYSRAARLIDIMEERGIVGPFEGSKPRSVTLTKGQWAEMKLRMQK